VFLDESQQLESHAAWPLGSGFPFLNRALARVEIAGEHRLADIIGFAKLLDLSRLDCNRNVEMALVEGAYGCLVEGANLVQHGCGRMDRLGKITFESSFRRHDISPLGLWPPEAARSVFFQYRMAPGQGAEILQFIVFDIGPILLREQVCVYPYGASARGGRAMNQFCTPRTVWRLTTLKPSVS